MSLFIAVWCQNNPSKLNSPTNIERTLTVAEPKSEKLHSVPLPLASLPENQYSERIYNYAILALEFT